MKPTRRELEDSIHKAVVIIARYRERAEQAERKLELFGIADRVNEALQTVVDDGEWCRINGITQPDFKEGA